MTRETVSHDDSLIFEFTPDLDGAFTASFDESGALALAFAWLLGVTALAAVQFNRFAAPRH